MVEQRVFKELIEKGDIAIYLDGILIVFETIEHHFRILKQVFKLLTQDLMELRLDKCKFLYQKIEYFGYSIFKDGIKPTDNGIIAIKNFPIPRSIRDVHSFLGLSSYFRKLIENFANYAKPLYDLLKKDVPFKFGIEELEAFEIIKKKLIAHTHTQVLFWLYIVRRTRQSYIVMPAL